jgi:uncharacterized membrane protein YedE/YeeE
MSNTRSDVHWKVYVLAGFFGIVAVTAVAALTGIWVLTAIPIGFLFGFFLQKGDLCGASAFSEVLLMKDTRKVAGLWVVIVVAMAGFAVLDGLGWVQLNPKPLFYASYLVGGVLFGVGMVLAGGCVSGCLYKAGAGNLNSIVALVGIPLGVMAVEFGPLHSLHSALRSYIVRTADEGVVSLPSLLGLPFWLLAVLFAVGTVAVVVFFRRNQEHGGDTSSPREPWLDRLLTRPWKPWMAGLAIGLLMIPAYLSSAASGRNYPLGVTHGVMQAELLLVDHGFNHVWKAGPAAPTATSAAAAKPTAPPPSGKRVVWWLVALVSSLVLGSWVSGRIAGQARLLPKPPDEVLIALVGGILVGIGAAFAGGCVVGNIMSGWALMSVGTVLFGLVTVVSNWATTYLYLMGRPSDFVK